MIKIKISNQEYEFKTVESLLFYLMHLSVIGVFFVPFSWQMVVLCAGTYMVRMFGITAGYHRYFAHRSYKMGRLAQFIMALIGTTALQKGVLWWAANHRHHHKSSDTPSDIHSPVQGGFWWSHIGWILVTDHDKVLWKEIPDLAKFPELTWLDRHALLPGTLLAISLLLIFGPAGFIWGFVVSTVLLWHGTFTINSLAHVWGKRRFHTPDNSRNNFWLALITLGEGWHNNHHAHMSSASQGLYWWEIDLTYYVLKALSKMGIVKDLRVPKLRHSELKSDKDLAA